MAYLIKPRLSPNKWLLKKSLAVIPLNTVIKAQALQRKGNQQQRFDEEFSLKRSMLEEFFSKKKFFFETSVARGRQNHCARLVKETLILCAKWQQAVLQETLAIESIAQHIAGNITLSTVMTNTVPHADETIISLLRRAFLVRLSLPQPYCDDMQYKYSFLTAAFFAQDFFTPAKNSEAKLMVTSSQSTMDLPFNVGAVDNILGNVAKILHNQINISLLMC